MEAQSALYQKIQTTYDFTDFEMQKMNFTISVIKYEFSKFIILGIVFALVGLFREYVVLMLTLILIRTFSGGIHFNHFSSCFLFTAIFIALPVLLSSIVVLPHTIQVIILAASVSITYLTGPVTSPKRLPLQYGRYRTYRLISTGIALIWFFVFAFARVFPYRNLCFWVISLQTIQLICAKLARKGDIYEKD